MWVGSPGGLQRARLGHAETVAGGDLPWLLPRSTSPSQLLVSVCHRHPSKEPSGPAVGPTAIWVSFALEELWGLPGVGGGPCTPSHVPLESGWLGSAEASRIPKGRPRPG